MMLSNDPETPETQRACEQAGPGELTAMTPRRRLQNRIAQRRFREKARARKVCMSQSAEDPTAMSPQMPNEPQSLAVMPLENDGLSPPADWGQNIPVQDLYPEIFSASSVHASLSAPLSHTQLLASSACGPSIPQLYQAGSQQHHPPSLSSLSLSSSSSSSSPSLSSWWPGISSADLLHKPSPSPGDMQYKGRGSVSLPAACSNQKLESPSRLQGTVEAVDLNTNEQKALATIQNQKVYLCREGEQLIEQVIELHRLAVCLELVPQDSHLPQLLSTTKEEFLSSFQGPYSRMLPGPGDRKMEDGHAVYEGGYGN